VSADAPEAPTAASANEAAIGTVRDQLRSFRHRYWAPVLLGLVSLFDGWDSIAIAYAMPSISAEWLWAPSSSGRHARRQRLASRSA